MYMFLPFLLALANCVLLGGSRLRSRTVWSYAVWTVTLAVTVAWFFHHATDPLNFSF